jgi:L-ascorbate metabolism protein UlaG (beta-lactamase superfamily)
MGSSFTQHNLYRLGDSTVAEPLINSWAVWSDLIAPAPYSQHLVNYQIKNMSSYLANPEMHVKAYRNPKLIGGPFIGVPVERAKEVEDLLARTVSAQRDNIQFANALTGFYEFLIKEARGQSLEPYYEKLPEELRGYVELNYDYYGHPIVRPIEGLLYQSPYYKQSLQSLRLFAQTRDDARPFFVNTPRLPENDQIDWAMPFRSPRLDEFFDLEFRPKSLDQICENLGLDADRQERLLPLLVEGPARTYQKWEGEGVRVRYFGHACALIEWKGVSILTDPFIGVTPREPGIDRFSYKDLPEKIDFVLITHTHHDHFVPETLLRIRRRVGCLVAPKTTGLFYADTSLKLMAQQLGFSRVIELDAMESIPVPYGEIIAVPFMGEHADLPHGKSGYVVRAGREQILFAADSNCLDRRMYEHLRRSLGPIETVFLGMECVGAPLSWLYGALLSHKLPHAYDQSRRTKGCDAKAALELLEAVGGKRVCIYAMGCEPWLQFAMGLGPAEDSVQIREANKALAAARERGFAVAHRPFGSFELHLGC